MSTLKVNAIRNVLATSDAVTLATDGTCTANITNKPNRNLIINGAMQVAQRGVSSTQGGRKTLDRFYMNWYNTDQVALTQSQSTDAPPDFSKSYKIDITTAENTLDANEYAWINYVLEAQDCQVLNYNSSNARSVTLSFWVKSYQTGDFAVNLNKYPDNTNRSITSTYTVNQSATWEKKTITFVGDTGGGGINDDNGAGIYIYFFLAAGSNYVGSSANTNQWANFTSSGWANGQTVNLFSSADNYFYITGVQLEVGSVATDFEHRSFGQEFRLCQRYYQQFTLPKDYASGAYSSYIYRTYLLPVRQRANGTGSVVSQCRYYSSGSGANFTPTVTPKIDNVLVQGLGLTNGNGFVDGTIALDAEL